MTLRGFGMTFANGAARNWYVGADGVKRWADNDENVAAEDRPLPTSGPLFDAIPTPRDPLRELSEDAE